MVGLDDGVAKILFEVFGALGISTGGVRLWQAYTKAKTESSDADVAGAKNKVESKLYETQLSATQVSLAEASARIDTLNTRISVAMQALTRVKAEARKERDTRSLQLRYLQRLHPTIDLSWMQEGPSKPAADAGDKEDRDPFETNFSPLGD